MTGSAAQSVSTPKSAAARTTSTAAAGTNCSDGLISADGNAAYDTSRYPNKLTQIAWPAEAVINCSAPVYELKYTMYAIDPQGTSHPIATGDCLGCATLSTTKTGYACNQAVPSGPGNCSGLWKLQKISIWELPPGETWSNSGGCVPAGSVLTCTVTADYGNASLYNVSTTDWQLTPEGMLPAITSTGLADIRTYHYATGTTDPSKSLFNADVDANKLAEIFTAGVKDTGAPWYLNANGYYEKDFPYSGVGKKSARVGGGKATGIELVVASHGDPTQKEANLVTMYPSDRDFT